VGWIENEEHEQIPDAFAERDFAEKELISYAIKNEIPIFGVCRGMQMLNVYFGGKLERNLTTVCQRPKAHVCDRHQIWITCEGVKRALKIDSAHTNSYHDQGILVNGLGKGLKHFAVAGREIVEGFYHSSHHIIGVQWHPERRYSEGMIDRLVVKAWADLSHYRAVFWNRTAGDLDSSMIKEIGRHD
jgi:putative glutamine amidotransferase